jgi:hypothetical protein
MLQPPKRMAGNADTHLAKRFDRIRNGYAEYRNVYRRALKTMRMSLGAASARDQ